MNLSQSLAAGFVLAAAVSVLAWRLKSLSPSGAAAATALGAVVFGLGGLAWAILLLAFFFSSSGLSRLFRRYKQGQVEKYAKGSRRDAAQVLANGGVAGGFVLLYLLFPQSAWPWLGFAGSLAAVNADTWATELGILNHSRPRLITTGRPVEPGTSGAVSLTGTLAALAGAALIAALAIAVWPGPERPTGLAAAAVGGLLALAGLAGSLADSWLGATLQSIYTCPVCQKETEQHPRHNCGSPTFRLRGLPWLNNEGVNAICALVGALLGLSARL